MLTSYTKESREAAARLKEHILKMLVPPKVDLMAQIAKAKKKNA